MLSSDIVKKTQAVALTAVMALAGACIPKPVRAADQPPLLDTLAKELQRNFGGLKQKADPAPYYAAYEVTDLNNTTIGATLGVLNGTGDGRRRYLDVTVRVGDNKVDNFRRVRGDRAQFTSGTAVALDDTPESIATRAWLETDRVYRAAAERLIKIRTNQQTKAEDRDKSDDFSNEESYMHQGATAAVTFDSKAWTEEVKQLSRAFRAYPHLLSSEVQISVQTDNRYFVNTEGTKVQHGRGFARVTITASAKSPDGGDLSDFEAFEAMDPKDLPSADVIATAVKRVGEHVEGLIKAPMAEPFAGPAIFSGRASGVFFHEIFGHRIEGHRQKDEAEGQTFTKSVGEKILPEFLSVTFDPTVKRIGQTDLNGWYEYDDEGVQAKPVKSVVNGVLKEFLMSRSPIEGFPHSNGHGRRQPGLEVVSRQSNLIVTSTKTVTDAKLREMLLEEIRRQSKPYGLYFEDISSGFTTTGRAGLQAFKVIPVIVYRVYADGRPDELIRGADIVGTPLASFSRILATSDTQAVFNGYCGAESGSVPVSAVSPAILISEIEIEKKDQTQDLLPLLASPFDGGAAR